VGSAILLAQNRLLHIPASQLFSFSCIESKSNAYMTPFLSGKDLGRSPHWYALNMYSSPTGTWNATYATLQPRNKYLIAVIKSLCVSYKSSFLQLLLVCFFRHSTPPFEKFVHPSSLYPLPYIPEPIIVPLSRGSSSILSFLVPFWHFRYSSSSLFK
jgi:hypothetical protein